MTIIGLLKNLKKTFPANTTFRTEFANLDQSFTK